MPTPMFDHCAYLESKEIDHSAEKKLLTRARHVLTLELKRT